MRFGWIRAFPKFALVFILIVGSTVAFCFWWFVLRPFENFGRGGPPEDIGPKLALLASSEGRLVLVDNDLYEIDTGKVIFKGWLKDGMPQGLFYDAAQKKFIARYDRGFVRSAPSGVAEAKLLPKGKAAFSEDLKWVLYVKDRDIWRADIDWKAFGLVNERKVSAVEQFTDTTFADNVILRTEKSLVVRNGNKLLHINLETGAVKPFQLPLGDIAQRRSPDSKSVVGLKNGEFYCYDVDSDDAKTGKVGRGNISDYQWLGNDRCLAIAGGKMVVVYDRIKQTFSELAPLPFQCSRIREPSPDGRFVFCTGRDKGVLVDVNAKTAEQVAGGAGVRWVSNDTFSFSREVPDSDLRGTWLQKVGDGERRVSLDPYLVGKSEGFIMAVPSADVLLFATKHGLSRMKPDGTEVAELLKLATPPSQALGIQEWKID